MLEGAEEKKKKGKENKERRGGRGVAILNGVASKVSSRGGHLNQDEGEG